MKSCLTSSNSKTEVSTLIEFKISASDISFISTFGSSFLAFGLVSLLTLVVFFVVFFLVSFGFSSSTLISSGSSCFGFSSSTLISFLTFDLVSFLTFSTFGFGSFFGFSGLAIEE